MPADLEKINEFETLAVTESADLQEALRVIARAYSETVSPTETTLGRLAAAGLALPESPVIVDAKKYFDEPDLDSLEELDRVWHGFSSFWLPDDPRHTRYREKPCFQRFEVVAPTLVGFINNSVGELNLSAQGGRKRIDRLSIVLPLAASLDLLSTRFISPDDSEVYWPNGNVRNNYLF